MTPAMRTIETNNFDYKYEIECDLRPGGVFRDFAVHVSFLGREVAQCPVEPAN